MRCVLFVLAVVFGVALVGVIVLVGRNPDATTSQPADVGGEVQCTTRQPIVERGAPGDDTSQQLARRMRRFCDAMNGTPPPAPPELVTAREVCLDLQARGQLLPGDDCDRVPADQTYHHH